MFVPGYHQLQQVVGKHHGHQEKASTLKVHDKFLVDLLQPIIVSANRLEQNLIFKLALTERCFLLCHPKKWGSGRAERAIFDGTKADETNLSDFGFLH